MVAHRVNHMVPHMVEHFPGKCSTICGTIRPTLNLHSNKPFRAVPGRAAGQGAAGAWRGAHAGWWCVAVLHTTNLIEKAVFNVNDFYYFLYN
jgi:hypothetical protein